MYRRRCYVLTFAALLAGGKQKGWLGTWQQFAAAGGSVISPHQEPENSPPWRNLLPQPLLYTSSLDDIDPVQVSELWSLTLREDREPLKVARAMRHSFAFILVRDPAGVNACGTAGRTVGIGRAISDGVFVATICDVAVHPEYQRRGIGRKIVKKLMQEIRGKGPTGFAVFPPPTTRRFFWMMGFRSDKKYKIMAYNGTVVKDSTSDISSQLEPPISEEADVVLNAEAISSSAREEGIDCTPNLNLEMMRHHNNAHASESQESQQKTESQERETVASPQLECNDQKTTRSLNVEDGGIEIGPHVYRTQMSDTRECEGSAVAMEAITLSEDHINVTVNVIEEVSCAKVIGRGAKDEASSSELDSPNIFYGAGV